MFDAATITAIADAEIDTGVKDYAKTGGGQVPDGDIPADIARDSEIPTNAEIEALIDATPLSDLQGQVTDAQIPAAIMRDAEFTAAAVRQLLGLTAAEVNNLLTGGTISGRTLTFTQNDGSDVTLTLPADQDTQDGVVASGAINAAGTELTLTLDTGTTVTIDIPAVLRGMGGGTADGQLRFGSGDPAGNLGIDGDAYLDFDSGSFWQRDSGAWTKRFEAQGVMHPIADDIRYFGWKATDTIVTADLDATLARVNSDTDDENEWPANGEVAYFFVAIPENPGRAYGAFPRPQSDQPDLPVREAGGDRRRSWRRSAHRDRVEQPVHGIDGCQTCQGRLLVGEDGDENPRSFGDTTVPGCSGGGAVPVVWSVPLRLRPR